MRPACIPLFALPDVVHFPRTELRLHVFEPRYRALVRDLLALDQGSRWIGMVLAKAHASSPEGEPEIFSAGTAGRLMAVEPLPDGRSIIRLRGVYRFTVERELAGRPYRQAIVRPIGEEPVSAADLGLLTVRQDLVDSAVALHREMGDRFPLDAAALDDLRAPRASFEEVINRLAAQLDVPVLRKQQLLYEDLPQRARNLLGILRARRRVLDLLRPYRRLAEGAEHN